MFRTNAFGQRITLTPRLRFVEGDADESGAVAEVKPKGGTDHGFPADTPLDQMKVEEREAYWKYQARKHEGTAKARGDYDDLKKDSEELKRLREEQQTEQEKAVKAAREEALKQGENIGADRYLGSAVKAHFRAATGLSVEDVDKAFSHVDAKSFIGDDGEINITSLDEFATTFGKKGNGQGQQGSGNPVRDALGGQQRAGGANGGAGSVADIKAQRLERISAAK